jgi:pimeloyl-ACP methyl ester carboxylesterase
MDASSLPAESHRYATLADGECYYRRGGPENGPMLLMIHGATVPGWEFDRLAPLLQAAGFQTLVPDLYGHGFSARPRIRYDYSLFTRQMTQLLEALSVDRPIDVFGHSMGAAIGARMANQDPGRFGRLVLAAPLVNFTGVMTSARLLALPALGELLMPFYIKPMLTRRRRKRYQAIEDGRWVDKFRQHIRTPGFGHMMLSLLRCGTLGDQSACYIELNRQHHDLLVLRGDQDAIMPRFQLERLRELLPRAKYIEIDGTPHAFVITDPEKLAPHIVEFLAPGRIA